MGIIIDIFQDSGEIPEHQKLFKMLKRNIFVHRGRLAIMAYRISSSPGDVGEDKDIACSNSSKVKGRLYASEFVLKGGTTVVEFLMFLNAGE